MKLIPVYVVLIILNAHFTLECRHMQHAIRSFLGRWLPEKEKKEDKKEDENFLFNHMLQLQEINHNKLRLSYGDFPKFESYPHYSDEGGCYDEGKAHEYRGPISVTESGTECADWSALSASMRSEMQESIELLKKRRKRKGFVRSSVNSAAEKVFIAIANDSLVEMEEKGLLGHNQCRDPDKLGRPWCFVGTVFSRVIWEPCAVPKCTICWRMRQRARKFYHLPQLMKLYWVPSCTLDGAFAALQCWDSYCWCSDREGTIIRGTMSKKRDGVPYCGVNFQLNVPRFTSIRTSTPHLSQKIKVKKVQDKTKEKKTKASKTHDGKKPKSKSSKRPFLKQIFKKPQKFSRRRKKTTKPVKEKNSHRIDESYHRTLNRTFSKGTPYNVSHNGKTYTCQIAYVITDVMHCRNTWPTKPSISKECFVRRKSHINGWRCYRKIANSKWHSFTYKRSNHTLAAESDFYVGMSFTCRKSKPSRKDNDVIECRAMNKLETHITIKREGGEALQCTKSYRDGKLMNHECVKVENPNNATPKRTKLFF